MRARFHPQLVHPPFGDPGLLVDLLSARRALLFDLGDLSPLPPRKILRITDVFVSHAHLDHFIGFDQLLRLLLGRDKRVRLFGPPGFVAQVSHRLAGYTWNLVEGYRNDLRLRVSEIDAGGERLGWRELSARERFASTGEGEEAIEDGVLLAEENLEVRAVVLDHGTPSLGFAVEEQVHVNVWKNRLEAMGLPVGPWLANLKRAVLAGVPRERPWTVRWRERGEERSRTLTLGALVDEAISIRPGQKVAYVADAAATEANRRAIVDLAGGADLLFIEAAFLDADAARGRERFHLTARQAGEIARHAGVIRVVPFHFSPRYTGRGDDLYAEVEQAFRGAGDAAGGTGARAGYTLAARDGSSRDGVQPLNRKPDPKEEEMAKVKLADLAEIPEGGMIMRQHGDTQILLARVEGKVVAMNDVCTHQGAPLHEGELGSEAGNPFLLTCPWHAAHFDLRTGQVYQDTPWATDTETFQVSVEDGEIYVEI